MDTTKDTKLGGWQSTFPRRTFLTGAAALAGAASAPKAFGQSPAAARAGSVWLYISTYTGAPGPRGRSGLGIYLCALDLFTGELTVVRLVAPVLPASGTTLSTASPSTIALDPKGTHLYAGNEYGPPGAVSAYSINRRTGDLTARRRSAGARARGRGHRGRARSARSVPAAAAGCEGPTCGRGNAVEARRGWSAPRSC